MAAALGPRTLPRPKSAVGPFLRVVSINDVYKLDNYPRVATAIAAAKADAKDLDCVVTSHLNGDFLSPCVLSALDGGKAMTEVLNLAGIDYVGIGNHEFDFGFDVFVARMREFKGKAINSNVSDAPLAGLPRYDIVSVGERKVVVTGLLTEDTSVYAPSNMPTITAAPTAAAAVWDEAKAALGGVVPDVHLPMTHALVPEDKQTAVALSKHSEMGDRTPVILGGHEHDLYIDEAGKSVIVKVGQDAERIAFIDIWWTADGTLRSMVQFLPCGEFDEDAPCLAFVKKQQGFLESMMEVPVASLPEPMSSKKVRFEPSGVATFLLSYVRRAFQKDHVDLAMVQGGFIRYKKEYSAGAFLMGDLFGEFAFEGPQALIPLKGSIIAESCRNTRSAPKPAPDFLHFDDQVVICPDTHEILSVGGAPFDPEKIYSVAIYHHLLSGLNVIEPLMTYVKENVKVPDLEACRPVKDLVLEVMVKDEWRRLVGFLQFDADGDGSISGDELKAGIEKVIAAMDKNGDGHVSKAELEAYMHDNDGNLSFLEQMVKQLDADGDGQISKDEFSALAY